MGIMLRIFPSSGAAWIRAASLTLLLAGSVMGMLRFMTSMPGKSPTSLKALPSSAAAIQEEIRSHLDSLARSERNIWQRPTMEQAAGHIEAAFQSMGMSVHRQTFEAFGVPVANLEAELLGIARPEKILVIGAHYDTVRGSPGADDNGSGVAALLSLARLFREKPTPITLRFVAFANEEPPFYYTPEMGSFRYAAACKADGDQVVGMIALETMGYFRDEPGSQEYPFPFKLFYPDRANFIAFVGNLDSRKLVRQTVEGFRRSGYLPAEGLAAPELVHGVGWSDHWSFWQHGYPALMVTDTAFFRNPHYHLPSDTVETLDIERLTRVVFGLESAIRSLAATWAQIPPG